MQRMRSKSVLLAAIAVFGFSAGAHAASYNFTTLDVPGAEFSYATGIEGGKILGVYLNNGYLYNGGTFTAIKVPVQGEYWTEANDIDGGNIVGSCLVGGNPRYGYLYDGASFTLLDVPASSTWTRANGIDGNNIVGSYIASGKYHGFLYDGTNYTTIDVPGAYHTQVYDIDGESIVGSYWYLDGAANHGFLYKNGNFTTFDMPGKSWIHPYGIEGGTIVGEAGLEGFIYDGTTFTSIVAPAPSGSSISQTHIYGIDNGTLVGKYTVFGTGAVHGFIATPVPIPGAFFLLGSGLLGLVAAGRRGSAL